MASNLVSGHEWDRPALLTWTAPITGKRIHDYDLNTTGGAVDAAIAQVPAGDLAGRLSVRCRASGIGHVSEVKLPLWEMRPPQSQPQSNSFDYEHGLYFEFGVYTDFATFSAVDHVVCRFTDGTPPELVRFIIGNSGKCGTQIGIAGTRLDESGTSISNQTVHTITCYYKPADPSVSNSGSIRMWVDGTELTDIAQSHNDTTSYSDVRFLLGQLAAGATNQDIYVLWHEIVEESVFDEFNYTVGSLRVKDRWAGHLRDVSQTEQRLFVHWHPGVHKAAWASFNDVQCRVWLNAGTEYDPTKAVAWGDAFDLPSADQFTKITAITGLSAGTEYHARLRFFRATNEDNYYETQHDIAINTLPTQDLSIDKFAEFHCGDHGQYQKPWKYALDRGVKRIVHLGDLVYNDEGGSVLVTDTSPSYTKDGLLRDTLFNIMADRFYVEAMRQIPMFFMPDDHDWLENNATPAYSHGAYRQGVVDPQLNPTGNDGSRYATSALCNTTTLNAAGITVDVLYDGTRPAAKILYFDGFIDVPRGGTGDYDIEFFRKCETKAALYALLDTRYFQDPNGSEPTSFSVAPGGSTMLGSGQLAYWLNEFQTTTKPIVFLCSPAAWVDLTSGNDNWKDIAPLERIQLEEALENNPNVEAVIIMSGDRHVTMIDQRKNDGQNSRSGFSFSKMVGTFMVGPIIKGMIPGYDSAWETADDVLFSEDLGIPGGRYAAMYPVFELDEINNTFRATVYDGDDTQIYDNTFSWSTCRPIRAITTGTQVVVLEEDVWGVVGSGTPLGIEMTSETMRQQIDMTRPKVDIGDGRAAEEPRLANRSAEGDIQGELQPHGAWPLIIKHALNATVTTAGSNTPYQHTIRGTAELLPKGLTIEKRFYLNDGSYKWLRYPGCRVNRMTIRVTQNRVATIRAAFLGKEQLEVFEDLDPSPDFPTDNEPFTSHQGALKMDLVASDTSTRQSLGTVQSIGFTIFNNLAGDDRGPSSGSGRRSLPESRRTISGSGTVFFDLVNWQIEEAFDQGKDLSLEFTLTRDQWSMQFVFPKIRIMGSPTPHVEGRGPMNIDFAFRAFYDASVDYDIQAVLTNNDPSLAT